MQGLCTNCNTTKNLHGNSGLCGNCYNQKLFTSKSPEEQAQIRERRKLAKAAWQKNHPDKVKLSNHKWQHAHPEYLYGANIKLVKLQKGAPIRTLQKAGIDTEFMRGQLEEHMTQKLALKIEGGMKLLFLEDAPLF